MQQLEQVVGLAGAGKTTYIVDQIVSSGYDPTEIACSSFTRAARHVLCQRCAAPLGVQPGWLAKHGHFKTTHSMAWRALGKTKDHMVPASIVGLADWLASHGGVGFYEDAYRVIDMWSAARMANKPVSTFIRDNKLPIDSRTLTFARKIIEGYEIAKARTRTLDHADSLGLFAGVKWAEDGTWIETSVRGEVPPSLRFVIVDEAQDASGLIYRAQCRLQQNAERVIVAGDAFQSIYSFIGSSPEYFLNWGEYTKRTVLPKTWRCLEAVWRTGLNVLKPTREWQDYHVDSAGPGGEVSKTSNLDAAIRAARDGSGTVLCLARTNSILTDMEKACDKLSIPYISEGEELSSAAARQAYAAICSLGEGRPVPVEMWKAGLSRIPARRLLQRSARKKWEAGEYRFDELHPDWLEQYGFRPEAATCIRSGRWEELLADSKGFRKWNRHRQNHGISEASTPTLRLSTVHGAKGMEADTVVVSSATSRLVAENYNRKSSSDEERRVAYVALTRAKSRVIIVNTISKHRFRLS